MMRETRGFVTAAIVLMACTALLLPAAAEADSYVVMAKKRFPRNFDAKILAAGGVVVGFMPKIGVAIVESSNSDFAATAMKRVKRLRSVTPDVVVQFIDPAEGGFIGIGDAVASPPFTGDDDFFFDLQWGHDAVDAPEAWTTGARGAGVRVAVLDSGIDADHPDIAPNLNMALSTSFVPGEAVDEMPSGFNHGTHVAGTIGAADNAFGTIGVAPEVELVAVKVLSSFTGSGDFGGIIQGIVYAANIDADIINMSLGVTGGYPHNCKFDDGAGGTVKFSGCSELFVATGRATRYATRQGTLVIATAGNEARNLDKDASTKEIPGELPQVVTVSATAPIGWAVDPTTNLDNLASYSNFGKSAIDFAAPGGDFVYPGNELCTVAGQTVPCWVFDLVFSTDNAGWSWAAGTSMAAPHVAGVAALIIGENGGSMRPAQVKRALRASADDLGKPGKDAAYGHGRVNAYNAVK